MWALIIAGVLSGALPEIEVRTAAGESAGGALVELDGRQLAIQGASGLIRWDIEKLVGVTVRGSNERNVPAAMAVELIDGSNLAIQSVTADQGKVPVKLADGQAIELSGADVRWLRLAQPGEAVAAAWSKILAGPTTADVLVVKKGDGIDYHKGILRRMTDDTIEFELDGERVPVRRGKVFGLVCHHASGRDLPEAAGTLADRFGSTWTFRTISLSGDQVEFTTVLGLKLRRPVADLARVDFSRNKAIHLSDLKPDSLEWVPYFGLGKELPSRVAMYSPRQDQNLDSGPLQLDGKRYAKGISLHSRTTIVYRLPDRYRRLVAVAGIDDSARPQGSVRLVIRGDDRVLFEAILTGAEAAKAIELDMSGVRRLTILADFGDDFDVGDHLDLCDARLLK